MEKAAKELHTQVIYGNMRGVKRALAAGAPVDGAPGSVFLPFLEASRWGFLGVVQLLLEKGANLEIATPRDPRTASEDILRYPRGTRAVHAAAYAERVEVLRALLEAGAQPNAKDGRERTPLMVASAAEERRVAMIGVLLQAGALPSLANNVGRLALHDAAHWGADDAIEVLVGAARSTLNHADKNGFTPLCVAAMAGQESTVRLLLSVGASDKEVWMAKKESALVLATRMKQEGTLAVLLEFGLEAVGGLDAVCTAVGHAIR